VAIARHYIDRGDYQTALPYANAAAESWAGWAMNVAAECESRLAHWEAADAWYQRVAERYDEVMPWYIWCRTSGHGSLAKARAAATAQLGHVDPYYIGLFYLAEIEPGQALASFRGSFAAHPFVGTALLEAAILDQQADAPARDAMLDALIAAAHEQSPKEPPREELLARQLRALLVKPVDPKADAADWQKNNG
jgi:hypothetical protein